MVITFADQKVEKMAVAYGVTEMTSEVSLTPRPFFERKGYKVVKISDFLLVWIWKRTGTNEKVCLSFLCFSCGKRMFLLPEPYVSRVRNVRFRAEKHRKWFVRWWNRLWSFLIFSWIQYSIMVCSFSGILSGWYSYISWIICSGGFPKSIQQY